MPAPDMPGDLAVVDLDEADDLDEEAVDLENFEDLDDEDLGEDLGDALSGDLEIADSPETELPETDPADLAEDTDAEDTDVAPPGEEPDGPAPAEAKAPGEVNDEEIFVFGDDDDDLPAAQVAVAGATADPVKD